MSDEYRTNIEDLARAAYCTYLEGTSRTRDESGAEFDRWLAEHDAKVLEDAADDPELRLSGHSGISIRGLRARAAAIRGQVNPTTHGEGSGKTPAKPHVSGREDER